jgi:hypothetical protein
VAGWSEAQSGAVGSSWFRKQINLTLTSGRNLTQLHVKRNLAESDLFGLNMKLNRGGLILSGIYTAISLALFAVAYLALDGNVKGQAILGQLAVAPAMMLLTYTHLINPLLKACPWLNSFYVFFATSFTIMYLIGWGFSRAFRRSGG